MIHDDEFRNDEVADQMEWTKTPLLTLLNFNNRTNQSMHDVAIALEQVEARKLENQPKPTRALKEACREAMIDFGRLQHNE